MTRLFPLVLAVALTASAFGNGQAGNKLRSVLQARYDALTKAYFLKDVDTAGEIFSVDYFGGTALHPFDRRKTLKMLKESNGVFKTTSRRIRSINPHGNTAAVLVETVTIGKMSGPKVAHRYVIKTTNSDDWIKNPAGWQLKRSRTVSSTTTEDGKPYHPNGVRR